MMEWDLSIPLAHARHRIDRLRRRQRRRQGRVGRLMQALRRLPRWLAQGHWLDRLVEQRVQARMATLFQQANYDALTHLPNRAHLMSMLESAVQDDVPFALLMIDLDGFKPVNDTWGHATGDALLKLVAARLTANVRATDVVARLGGDEFVVMLREIERPADVASVCRRLLQELSRPFWVETHVVNIGASIGVAQFPRHGRVAAMLMERADAALYAAKRAGRGRFVCFDERLAARSQQAVMWRKRFEQALLHRRFEVRFRPMIRVADGSQEAAQLDVFWPDGPPDQQWYGQWQHWLKASGRRAAMAQWIVDTAAWHLGRWQHLPPGFRLWVPLDAALILRHEAALSAFLTERLSQRWVTPEQLVWIVPLSVLAHLSEAQLSALDALRQAGFQLAVEGIGRQPMALAPLSRIGVDALIIDPAWAGQLLSSPPARRWLAGLVALAEPLTARVYVPEQAPAQAALRSVGVHWTSGSAETAYQPADEFEAELMTRAAGQRLTA